MSLVVRLISISHSSKLMIKAQEDWCGSGHVFCFADRGWGWGGGGVLVWSALLRPHPLGEGGASKCLSVCQNNGAQGAFKLLHFEKQTGVENWQVNSFCQPGRPYLYEQSEQESRNPCIPSSPSSPTLPTGRKQYGMLWGHGTLPGSFSESRRTKMILFFFAI